METVAIKVHLPRILMALLVGGALSVAGAAYQNLFRNPLMAPEMSGASWGSAFSAVLGIIEIQVGSIINKLKKELYRLVS